MATTETDESKMFWGNVLGRETSHENARMTLGSAGRGERYSRIKQAGCF